MASRFTLAVELLQPVVGGTPQSWHARGRWVSASGSGTTVIDSSLASDRRRVLEVWKAPGGLGTRWQVEVEDVRYDVDDVWLSANAIGVKVLLLSTTVETGEVVGRG